MRKGSQAELLESLSCCRRARLVSQRVGCTLCRDKGLTVRRAQPYLPLLTRGLQTQFATVRDTGLRRPVLPHWVVRAGRHV
jgi:hypothetical protein